MSSFFQHLVWILGLKPSTGGSLKAGRTTADSNAVITTAVMADLPVLSAMLSRLFESSQYLDDVALHHLIDALCKLSHEAMELAYSNRVSNFHYLHMKPVTRFRCWFVTAIVCNILPCRQHLSYRYVMSGIMMGGQLLCFKVEHETSTDKVSID